MASPPLSPETEKRIDMMFPPDQRAEVRRMLLEEVGHNLWGLEKLNEYQMDRYRFAVLRLSKGDFEKLPSVIEITNRDWRDLLVWSGFGSGDHNWWLPEKKF